jgi:hypothetical protein
MNLKRKVANDFQSSSLSVFGSSATSAGKDELFELGYAARDARADGAKRDLENVGDFLIRRVVQVEEGQRRAKWFLDLSEVLDCLNAIE